jgi:3D (Asp-Asp-Asp) domain-containing protein
LSKHDLMIPICVAFSICITGIGLHYRNQLDAEEMFSNTLLTQISDLSKSANKLQETNVVLKDQLIKQDRDMQSMVTYTNSIIKNGGWCFKKGIATAYSPFDNVSGIEAGADPNKTSIGLRPSRGIIAVDPKRIPYNSEMMVIYPDGKVYKGIAGDTGGALRNDDDYHVDIYKDTYQQTEKHGVQNVIILWKPKKAVE